MYQAQPRANPTRLLLLFLALALALPRAGTRRREEDQEGPLLKLV